MNKKGWKVWFYFMMIAWVIGLFDLVLGDLHIWSFTQFFFTTIQTIGLYGLCWDKRIISRVFWRVFFLGDLIIEGVNYFIVSKHVIAAAHLPVILLIGLILVFIQLRAIYLYAWVDKTIWET